MKKNQVYISCPIAEPQEKIFRVARLLEDKGYTPVYWTRASRYNTSMLQESEAMVLIPPDNIFAGLNKSVLPPGCWKELQIAIACSKSIFLAYVRTDNALKLYQTEMFYAGILNGIFGFYMPDAVIRVPQYSFFNLKHYART